MAVAWPERVRLWDAALAAVRGYFRDEGLREVSTPVRVGAVAIEPFIEPIAAPPGLLITSPELAMKRLLARGSGPIFQISHVFRQAERGERHSEEFHLIEWYRVGEPLDAVVADVARLVARVFEATGFAGHVPKRWQALAFRDAVRSTCGAELAGDEEPAALLAALPPGLAAATRAGIAAAAPSTPAAARLLAWTAFFSAWSDMYFEPWLKGQEGVQLGEFPAPLAALAELDASRRVARRAECHVAGLELANGYQELRDPDEQRRRFAAVAELRAALGLRPLPVDEEFLAELPRMPACSGMALGLERLLALAAGQTRIEDVSLALGSA